MNLRLMANAATRVINPNIKVIWIQSTGYTTDAAGKRTPTTKSTDYIGQVQAVSAEDLRHIDGLNMQALMRTVYVYGNLQGVVRPDSKGGDILQFAQVPGGAVQDWLVTHVKETWPDWASVIVTLQT